MPDRFGDPIEPTPEPVSDAVWAAEQRRQAIQACTLCDGDGYNGLQVCPHEDFRPAAVRGRQLITQTLAEVRDRKADQ